MCTAREGHGDLGGLATGLLLGEGIFQHRGVDADLQIGIGCTDRDRLRVEIEAGEDRHRQWLVVLRHLASRDEIGHRSQDMGAVDTGAGRAEHQIVAGRAPGGLLHHLDLGHAVLVEQTLLFGDDQRG